MRDRPGGFNYWVAVSDPHSDASVVAHSPSGGEPWQGIMNTTESTRNFDFGARAEVPLDVSTSGNEVRLVLDLPEDSELLNHQPFAPPITIQSFMSDRSVLADPDSVGIMFKPQQCEWSTPVAAVSDNPSRNLPPQPTEPPAQTGPQPRPSAVFPPGSRPCPQKYGVTGPYTRSAVGNDQTSCPFAEAVRISYADMGVPGSAQEIKVSSPITEQLYDVTCQPAGGVIVCTGGNGAVVYLN